MLISSSTFLAMALRQHVALLALASCTSGARRRPREVAALVSMSSDEELAQMPLKRNAPQAFTWGKSLDDLYGGADEQQPDAADRALQWGCHTYVHGQDDMWCNDDNDLAGKRPGFRYRHFADSPCGACGCCVAPDDEVVKATAGLVENPMRAKDDYVELPDGSTTGGSIDLPLFCKGAATLTITGLVLTPAGSDSFSIRTDGSYKTWSTGPVSHEFAWAKDSPSVIAKAGENTLQIKAVHGGAKIKAVSFASGGDHCSLRPGAGPPPEPATPPEKVADQKPEEPPAEYDGSQMTWGKSLDDLYSQTPLGIDSVDPSLPWGCHSFAAGQNNDWCNNDAAEGKRSGFQYHHFAESPCGTCQCCSLPDGDIVKASAGSIRAPMRSNSDYVELSEGSTAGGRIDIPLFCKDATALSITGLVHAPDADSESFIVGIDGSDKTWSTGVNSEWVWAKASPSVSAKAGNNILQIKGRQSGIKIKVVAFASGGDHCSLAEVSATAPAPAQPVEPAPAQPVEEAPAPEDPSFEPAPAPVQAPQRGVNDKDASVRSVGADLLFLVGLVLFTLRI